MSSAGKKLARSSVLFLIVWCYYTIL